MPFALKKAAVQLLLCARREEGDRCENSLNPPRLGIKTHKNRQLTVSGWERGSQVPTRHSRAQREAQGYSRLLSSAPAGPAALECPFPFSAPTRDSPFIGSDAASSRKLSLLCLSRWEWPPLLLAPIPSLLWALIMAPPSVPAQGLAPSHLALLGDRAALHPPCPGLSPLWDPLPARPGQVDKGQG